MNVRFEWLLSFAFLIGFASPSIALEVVVGDAVIVADGTGITEGFVDVYLRLGTGETAPELAGWQAAVDLVPGDSGAEIVSPYAETTALPEHAPLIIDNFLPDFGLDSGPARASATAFLASGTATVVDGAGLMRIPFQVAPGTTGEFSVLLDLDPVSGTLLVDGAAAPIAFMGVNGTLSVVAPAPTVPSLPAWGLTVLIGLIAVVGRRVIAVGCIA